VFIQVIQGRTDEPQKLRAATEQWAETVAPGAEGWLGLTGGVTADGRFLVSVRFVSEEAARRNSGRAEQDQWWAETSKLLEEVAFHDCADVDTMLGGGSDEAGFVQVMQGRVRDRDRLKELSTGMEDTMRAHRPDVLGATSAFADDGTGTQVVYFRSEAEARDYERTQPPPDVAARLAEMDSLLGDLTYYDLPDPWLLSPR
jgi:hypothetical protein